MFAEEAAFKGKDFRNFPFNFLALVTSLILIHTDITARWEEHPPQRFHWFTQTSRSWSSSLHHVLHSLLQSVIASAVKLITVRFFWFDVHRTITAWARSYFLHQHCQVYWQRHVRSLLGQFRPPDTSFRHIHIDLVGSWSVSSSFTYILTCIDRFSRWPEAISLIDITAESVAWTLTTSSIAHLVSPPWSLLIVDASSKHLFSVNCHSYWVYKHIHTIYHPASNIMVERLHWQLQTALRATLYPLPWTEFLLVVLLSCRSIVKAHLSYPAAEFLYGTTLALPGQMLAPVDSLHPNLMSYFVYHQTSFLLLGSATYGTSWPVYFFCCSSGYLYMDT